MLLTSSWVLDSEVWSDARLLVASLLACCYFASLSLWYFSMTRRSRSLVLWYCFLIIAALFAMFWSRAILTHIVVETQHPMIERNDTTKSKTAFPWDTAPGLSSLWYDWAYTICFLSCFLGEFLVSYGKIPEREAFLSSSFILCIPSYTVPMQFLLSYFSPITISAIVSC